MGIGYHLAVTISLHVAPSRGCHKNTFGSTSTQFTTAKILGCALKQWGKAHSTLQQGSKQLQSGFADVSSNKVEERRYAAWMADTLGMTD